MRKIFFLFYIHCFYYFYLKFSFVLDSDNHVIKNISYITFDTYKWHKIKFMKINEENNFSFAYSVFLLLKFQNIFCFRMWESGNKIERDVIILNVLLFVFKTINEMKRINVGYLEFSVDCKSINLF